MNFNNILSLSLSSIFCFIQLAASPVNTKATAIATALNSILGTQVENVGVVEGILSACDSQSCNNLVVMSALTKLSLDSVFDIVMEKLDGICDVQMKAYLMIHLLSTLPTIERKRYFVETHNIECIDERCFIAEKCVRGLLAKPFKPLALLKSAQLPEGFSRELKNKSLAPLGPLFARFQRHLVRCANAEVRAGLRLGDYGEEVTNIFSLPSFLPKNFRIYIRAGLPSTYVSPKHGSWTDQALKCGRNDLLDITVRFKSKITKPELLKTDAQIGVIRQVIKEVVTYQLQKRFGLLRGGTTDEGSSMFGVPVDVFGKEMFAKMYELEVDGVVEIIFENFPPAAVMVKLTNFDFTPEAKSS